MKRFTLLLLLPFMITSSLAETINWPQAFRGIAAGEKVWLSKVPALAAVADVQQAIHLEDALSSALTTNTPGALDALKIIDAGKWPHMIGTDMICGVPVEKPPAVVEDFYQQTRLALLRSEKGASCLWFLEATYEEWKAEKPTSLTKVIIPLSSGRALFCQPGQRPQPNCGPQSKLCKWCRG